MNLKQIFTGKISKRELGLIYFPVIIIVTAFWAIARILYPQDGGYYANFNFISRQGNLILNPVGGWFFIIGTAIAGLLLIPYFIYIARQMAPTLKLFNWLFLLCGILGAMGLMVVGLVYESDVMPQGEIHSIGAFFAFAGLSTAVALSFLILFIRILQKRTWPSWGQFINLFWMELFFLSMWFFTLDSVNQWAGFYIVFTWCTAMYMILPDNKENIAKNED